MLSVSKLYIQIKVLFVWLFLYIINACYLHHWSHLSPYPFMTMLSSYSEFPPYGWSLYTPALADDSDRLSGGFSGDIMVSSMDSLWNCWIGVIGLLGKTAEFEVLPPSGAVAIFKLLLALLDTTLDSSDNTDLWEVLKGGEAALFTNLFKFLPVSTSKFKYSQTIFDLTFGSVVDVNFFMMSNHLNMVS